jgi:hypothetical protein
MGGPSSGILSGATLGLLSSVVITKKLINKNPRSTIGVISVFGFFFFVRLTPGLRRSLTAMFIASITDFVLRHYRTGIPHS